VLVGEVVGALLPVALGVAISPVPLIAVILMLLAARARAASVAFLVGWVVGIALVVGVVALVVDPVDDSQPSGPSTFVSILKLVLGVAAILLGIGQWRRRPTPGAEPVLPQWMAAVDTMTAGKAFGLGALLAAVNPKNLTLCLTGGVIIGSGGLAAGEAVVAVVVFVVIGSCSVAVPVLGNLVARERMREPLEELRTWLTAHNAAVMSVLLLVIGVKVLGDGIAGL
jgi:threonine/homoserine/homoserine lactone efflux protein